MPDRTTRCVRTECLASRSTTESGISRNDTAFSRAPAGPLLAARCALGGSYQRDEGQRGVARAALRMHAPRAFGEGRARDVAVDPGDLTHEFPQEQGGRDGATVAIARVLQIRDVALELLTELLEERHAPELLPGRARRSS